MIPLASFIFYKCKSEYIRKSLYIYINIYKMYIILLVKYVH
ncbi:hypothetical protein HMPREF3233_01917 [Veillonella atypica]|uniref:Uncharacterized protein n=1 Tax=Veillonella atypica TaxID=39777 RepID=A0A133RZY7_9FIRM|nr:hypothetical protein HMPREF3233_01917 [Veillonella atypica]